MASDALKIGNARIKFVGHSIAWCKKSPHTHSMARRTEFVSRKQSFSFTHVFWVHGYLAVKLHLKLKL